MEDAEFGMYAGCVISMCHGLQNVSGTVSPRGGRPTLRLGRDHSSAKSRLPWMTHAFGCNNDGDLIAVSNLLSLDCYVGAEETGRIYATCHDASHETAGWSEHVDVCSPNS